MSRNGDWSRHAAGAHSARTQGRRNRRVDDGPQPPGSDADDAALCGAAGRRAGAGGFGRLCSEGRLAKLWPRRRANCSANGERRARRARRRFKRESLRALSELRVTPLCPVGVVRVRGSSRVTEPDRVVTEEPLEIRLHGRPFAVIMRTPGADRELAAGFLLAERVIGGADDLGAIEYCLEGQVGQVGRVGQVAPMGQAGQVGQRGSNVVNVTLTEPELVERALAERRQITTNSSCGLCGRRTIESLWADVAPIDASWTVPADVLVGLPQQFCRGCRPS